MKINNLYKEDCIDTMSRMPDNFIDLTVTSPPYDDMRSYEKGIDWVWGESIWKPIIRELYRVTVTGGVVAWIIGDRTKNGTESGTSFRQALWGMECGFNLHDTMIYEKHQSVFGSNLCYLQSFEYMFIFSKGKPKIINFIRDRINIRSGKEKMASHGMSKDGEKSSRIYKELSKTGKRKNIWTYGVGGGKTGHPAVFPEKLARDHIISWSNEGCLVYDPFMGSGTTAKMAILNNRNWIGSERVSKYCKIIEERIKNI